MGDRGCLPRGAVDGGQGRPDRPSIQNASQNASVEELAKVKGLNLKIAEEIVRARPFASLEDLVRVRGIGAKTVARLKDLVTL